MSVFPAIKHWTIYKITNPIGQVYIGKTRSLKNRIRQYRYSAHPHHGLVYNSIKEYGFVNHQFDILEQFEGDENYSDGKEFFWIRTCMSNRNKWPELKGLNLTNGGGGNRGNKNSEKQRITASIIHKGNKYNLGKKESVEAKGRRIKKLTGLKRTEDQCLRIQESNIRLRGKEVIQIDKFGNLLKEFPTIISAAKELNVSDIMIRRVLRGRQDNTKGLYFKYK